MLHQINYYFQKHLAFFFFFWFSAEFSLLVQKAYWYLSMLASWPVATLIGLNQVHSPSLLFHYSFLLSIVFMLVYGSCGFLDFLFFIYIFWFFEYWVEMNQETMIMKFEWFIWWHYDLFLFFFFGAFEMQVDKFECANASC